MFSKYMHTSEDTKRISSRVATEYTWWSNTSLASEDAKIYSTRDDQTQPITRRTWQQGHKVYLIACWLYTSHAREDTKCITNRVDKAPQMSERTQNVFQHLLTKSFHTSNICFPNQCIPAKTQNASQFVLPPNTQSASLQVMIKPVRTQKVNQHAMTKTTHNYEDT